MTLEVKSEYHEKQNEKNDAKKLYKFRCFLSQFVATTAENMLLFDMGICQTFPFVIIAALTGISNEHNVNEQLNLTPAQASWIGSIAYIFEPIGAILSAFVTDFLGRKMAMIVVNVPIIIAWFMMFYSSSVLEIFIANMLLGFGAGLMESPVITYVGEICDPTFRGIMIAYTHVGYTLGMLFLAILNTLMPWRIVAACCMLIPILTTIMLLFVPETPIWLLSKNRTADAEKSLCWLRGWVSRENVAEEFQALERCSQRYKSCNECIRRDQKCSHPLPTFTEKLKELKRKQTLRPFFIVMALFVIASFSGIFAMMPFIVQIFKAYSSPMEPSIATAWLNIINNMGNLVFLCLLRFTGKRYLYLTMLSVVFLSSAVLSGYGFAFLPPGYNSFDQSQHFSLDNPQLAYIPFVCILVLSFCSYVGVKTMPWQMISEVFPYKTRAAATGITAALNYLLGFVAIKTYYNFETSLSMPGMALFNCIVIAIGLVLMYKILPETENRSLEDIEIHFADKSKKITDCKIARASKVLETKLKPDLTMKAEQTNYAYNSNIDGSVNRGFVDER